MAGASRAWRTCAAFSEFSVSGLGSWVSGFIRVECVFEGFILVQSLRVSGLCRRSSGMMLEGCFPTNAFQPPPPAGSTSHVRSQAVVNHKPVYFRFRDPFE